MKSANQHGARFDPPPTSLQSEAAPDIQAQKERRCPGGGGCGMRVEGGHLLAEERQDEPEPVHGAHRRARVPCRPDAPTIGLPSGGRVAGRQPRGRDQPTSTPPQEPPASNGTRENQGRRHGSGPRDWPGSQGEDMAAQGHAPGSRTLKPPSTVFGVRPGDSLPETRPKSQEGRRRRVNPSGQ